MDRAEQTVALTVLLSSKYKQWSNQPKAANWKLTVKTMCHYTHQLKRLKVTQMTYCNTPCRLLQFDFERFWDLNTRTINWILFVELKASKKRTFYLSADVSLLLIYVLYVVTRNQGFRNVWGHLKTELPLQGVLSDVSAQYTSYLQTSWFCDYDKNNNRVPAVFTKLNLRLFMAFLIPPWT